MSSRKSTILNDVCSILGIIVDPVQMIAPLALGAAASLPVHYVHFSNDIHMTTNDGRHGLVSDEYPATGLGLAFARPWKATN